MTPRRSFSFETRRWQMLKRAKNWVAAGVLAVACLLGAASSARADYYVWVPRTVYVTKHDHYGRPYYVPYTVYVRVLVKTGY
jgi:hypothetical protein